MIKETQMVVFEPEIEWNKSPEEMGKQVTTVLNKYKDLGIIVEAITIKAQEITRLTLQSSFIDVSKLEEVRAEDLVQ
jgi:hypothetical protein